MSSIDSLSDELLAARVAAHDAEAFAALYRRHRPGALRLAISLSASREVAEDVVQEAFLSVWRQARGFNAHRGRFAPWLNTIVRNRATDAWRRAASRPQLQVMPEAEIVAGEQVEAPDGIERQAMRSLLTQLPAEQRDAIFLAYYADMTAEQIAVRGGVPLGTVKGRLRLGLAKLRAGVREPVAASAA